MDHHTPDLRDDFDYDCFLNFPPEEEPQMAGAPHFGNHDISSEFNSELNFEPQTPSLGHYSNDHIDPRVLVDSEQLPLHTAFNLASLNSGEVDAAGDSAGSHGHSLARKDGQDAFLDIPTANMDTIIQCHTTDNAQGHDESSVVIADSKNTGALQQVMITPVKTSPSRNRVPVRLGHSQNCERFTGHCRYCRIAGYDSIPDRCAPRNKVHSWLELCENTECDSRYGILRVIDTLHHFKAQSCHGRPINCRCGVETCDFVSARFSDLRRHHATKHCIQPKRYPCPEPFCDRGGENGFKRQDKLKDHHRKVHEGKLRLVQVQRPIQSAAAKPALE